jgi:hypothetical protein
MVGSPAPEAPALPVNTFEIGIGSQESGNSCMMVHRGTYNSFAERLPPERNNFVIIALSQ